MSTSRFLAAMTIATWALLGWVANNPMYWLGIAAVVGAAVWWEKRDVVLSWWIRRTGVRRGR